MTAAAGTSADELLGRRDAVHVRHVDVHQDDVRRERRRRASIASRPGRRRPHDLDVRLEAEKLREVIAGLGDVVDDQDADLVCHGSRGMQVGSMDGWVGRRWAGCAPAHRVASCRRRACGLGGRSYGATCGYGRRLDDLDELRRENAQVVDELAERDAGGRDDRAGRGRGRGCAREGGRARARARALARAGARGLAVGGDRGRARCCRRSGRT